MILTSGAIAQVTHQVTVQNFEFVPQNLEINEGDIVEWTNVEGFHNVNGTFDTFPGNTETFGNETGGPGWTYSFTFNSVGVNDYLCDVHPEQMQATVTVVAALDCPDLEANIGDDCDDENGETENDVVTAECECEGELIVGEDENSLAGDGLISHLSAYPNPTNGICQVVFTTSGTALTMVEVYNMNGRFVSTLYNQVAVKGQEYRIDFDGSALSDGVYIYRLTTATESIIEKFIIAR
jgi:plastocyanin